MTLTPASNKWLIAIALCLACLCACATDSRAAIAVIQKTANGYEATSGQFHAYINLRTGTYTITGAGARPYITDAAIAWTTAPPGAEPRTTFSTDPAKRYARVEAFADRSGFGKKLVTRSVHPESGADFITWFKFYNDKPLVVIIPSIANKTNTPLAITASIPLAPSPSFPATFAPGSELSSVRMLETSLSPGNPVRLLSATSPLSSSGNAIFHDLTSRTTTVIGFVTAVRGSGSIAAIPHENALQLTAAAGYSPAATLQPGKVFSGERLFIGLSAESSPHPSLTRFAEAITANNSPATRNSSVPVTWDPAVTPYGLSFTETDLVENFEKATRMFQSYGMSIFHIGEGWQTAVGDWSPDSRFPRGFKWLGDEITSAGMAPGLWIAPFCADPGSAIAIEHPLWFSRQTTATPGIPPGWLLLDTTHPQAAAWLAGIIRTITTDWGARYLKIDHTACARLATKHAAEGTTPTESLRAGLATIRDAAAPGTFISASDISPVEAAGLVDAVTTGSAVANPATAAQNIARKYFYPSTLDPSPLPLAADEARAAVSLAALSGSVVNIGDAFTSLDLQQVTMIRSITPSYARPARPIDLFDSETPSIWLLPVSKSGFAFDLAGIFDWDGDAQSPAREFHIPLASLGLDVNSEYVAFEYWSQELAGVYRGELSVALPSNGTAIYALHRLAGRPLFAGHNRHVTLGATDISDISWSDASATLSGRIHADPYFHYKLHFYVPDGFRPESARVEGRPAAITTAGNLMSVEFSRNEPADLTWVIKFDR